jgi:hypothetical protein
VQVILPGGATLRDVEPAVREVMEQGLAGLPAFREALLRGEYAVC